VFLTNLRPDAVERMGLDHQTVLKKHPRLVYATVTGYGLEGPDRLRPGYDVGAFSARSGLAALQGEPYGEPVGVRSGMGDHVTSMNMLTGILAALLYRERTGQGQLVATSLLRCGIYSLGWEIGIQLRFGKLGTTQPRTEAANPMINCYACADGRWFWLLGLEAERHWPALMSALGRPSELVDDERFADPRGRRKNAVDCVAILDRIFATKSRDDWTAIFDQHDVWWAPVQTAAEVVADPQAVAAGAFVDVPEGRESAAHRAVNNPIDFGAYTFEPKPPPGLGEHTEEILKEIS
jgi:crotonobetainyl-CoA:carnitine CoA-transferase CaiB-like acyl-CoA transferase